MLYASLAVVAGLALLVWSADRFIDGAASLARHLGVSTLIIGMVIVGFGTSAPELMVSTIAALQGNPGLAVGNAIGSNIANIALILGVTALLVPLTVHSGILRKELPVLLGATFAAWFLLIDGTLSRMDGLLLLATLFGYMGWVTHSALQQRNDVVVAEFAEEIPEEMPLGKSVLWTIIGLLVLLASSRLLVWGAVEIATALGVSDLVIGLTIVAIGTSLPELAASITSARKGEPDLAIGNIIGSNLFNLLGVLGIPGVLSPLALPEQVNTRDYPVMLGLTIALFALAYGWGRGTPQIGRIGALMLLIVFVGYQITLFVSASPV
ncbi:MAG: calcium/sodium antiporter [Thiotrichales bacterium]